jgi:hypothetical protein
MIYIVETKEEIIDKLRAVVDEWVDSGDYKYADKDLGYEIIDEIYNDNDGKFEFEWAKNRLKEEMDEYEENYEPSGSYEDSEEFKDRYL